MTSAFNDEHRKLPNLEVTEFLALKSSVDEILGELNSSQKIPQDLVNYLVVGEDRRHGVHIGFDLVGIFRACWRFLTGPRVEGASTIAQQLVRTITGRRELSLGRKIDEIIKSVMLTSAFSADQIARCYLSVAYFGSSMKGVHAAASRLGFDLNSLSAREAAELVARIKYPQPQHATACYNSKIANRTRYLLLRAEDYRWVKHPKFNQSENHLWSPSILLSAQASSKSSILKRTILWMSRTASRIMN